MDNKTLLDSLRRMATAYSELDRAKSDCADVIDSEIDLLVAASNDPITAGQKKSIKKIAKSMADEKVESLTEEAQGMADLLLIVMEQ